MKSRIALLALCTLAVAASRSFADGPVVWNLEDGGNGHAYEWIDGSLTWTDARDLATQRTPPAGFRQGHLLTICDFHENYFLQSAPWSGSAWMGFSDSQHEGRREGSWEWIDNTPGPWVEVERTASSVYTNWGAGQPTEVIGDNPPTNVTDYAYFGLPEAMWGGASLLTGRAGLVIEYEPVNAMQEPCPETTFPQSVIIATAYNPVTRHTYHLLPRSSWSAAEKAALSLGGHLVAINDAAEGTWLNEFAGAVWTGLNDADREGQYVWSNGEPVTYTNWGPAQPSGGDEDYIHTGYFTGEDWNDIADYAQYRSVVEIAPPHVTAVEIGGLSWATDRYAMPIGSAEQLTPLPWTRMNQIALRFDEEVVIPAGAIGLSDSRGNEYPLFGPFTGLADSGDGPLAIWMTESFLPLGEYTLTLRDTVEGDEGTQLDGEWVDGASAVSGDGPAGGDFEFRFRVLPGDANQDGIVNVFDMIEIRNHLGTTTGGEGYSQFHDIDTRGSITLADVLAAGVRAYDVLPTQTAAQNTAAVPEPSAFALATLAVVLVAAQRSIKKPPARP